MEAKVERKLVTKRRILLALVVLVVSVMSILETRYVHSLLEREVAAAVQRELGLEASLGAIELRLPFRIAVHTVRLNHPRHGLLVSARELLIVPSLWGLVRGQLKLKRLIIEGARVRLRIRDGAIVNLPEFAQAKPEDETDEPVRIPFDELLLHRAKLDIDGRPNFTGALHSVNLVARVADQTRVSLQLSAEKGELSHAQGTERLLRAQLSARYKPGQLEVQQLRLESTVGTVGVRDASFGLPFVGGRYRGAVQLEVDLARFMTLPHGLSLPALSGKLALTAQVSGSGRRFRVQGDLHGERPVLEGFGFGVLDLKLDANEREVLLLPGSKAHIIEEGGLVVMEGKLGLSRELPLEMRVDVKHLVFQKLMAQLGTTQNCVVDWLLRGGFRLKGTLNPLAIGGPIWADHLSFRALTGPYHDPNSREVIGTPPGRVSGRVSVRPDALRFENLHGKLPHSEMQVSVHIGFDDKLGVSAKSQNLDLRDATGLMQDPIAGHGPFTLEVGGTYSNTTLTGTLDLQDFVFWGNPVGHLKTRAVMEKDGSAVRFLETEVHKNESHYVVDDLLLDFSREFELTAKARFDKLTLSDFYHSLAVDQDPDFKPYQGALRGSAEARYTLGFASDGPEGTLVVDAGLDVLAASAFGVEFTGGRLEGKFTWRDIEDGTRGARLDLHELQLHKGRGSLFARGVMDYGTQLRLTVVGQALRARELTMLRESGLAFDGELNAAGTVRGTLGVPELALDLELVGMQVGNRLLGDGHGKLYLTHRDDPWVQRALAFGAEAPSGEPCPRARAALAKATWGSPVEGEPRSPPQAVLVCGDLLRDRLRSDLAIGLDAEVSVRGSLALNALPTAWLLPERTGRLSAFLGHVSASAELTGGGLRNADSLVGQLELGDVSLGLPRPWIRNDGPVRVTLTGQGARIARAQFLGEGTQIGLQGGASIAHGLAASIAGTLDLSVLPSFVPNVTSASGVLSVDVKLTGVFRNPAIFGRAELNDARILTTLYPQVFDGVEARLTFSERELLLEELQANFAGGTLRMHGSAALAGRALARYDLELDARDITLEPSPGIEVTLGLETTLRGSDTSRVPTLAGIVRLTRARYTRPFSLGIAERLTGFSQAKRAERQAYDPDNDRLALDLRVIDEGPLRVANNLLTAELSIEDSERPFRVVGTDQRIGVLGNLVIDRGTLRFRSSEFRVEEGTVSFNDERRIRPQIDVHARTEFRRTADATGARWSILLHAFGDADDLKLETSSEPALASEDIALLLTVGLTRAEAERLETGSLTQGAALEALATVAGVDREVKRALPVIDDFAVTSAYSVRTNRTEPQVVVGKRLSDRVRASATTGLTTDSNFKTNVQWRLNDQTSLEASYDNVQTTTASQFGNVGVDLRWRLEFD